MKYPSSSFSTSFLRFSIFIVYFWFGVLKIFDLSPASQLVYELWSRTIPFIDFQLFYITFAIGECIIGLLFLFPKITKIATTLLFLHIFTTILPLIVLPSLVWQSFLVPTLEGQYIIKNILLVASALAVGTAHRKAVTTT